MKTDKNTIIGFVLLGVLFFVYFWYSSKTNNAYLAEKKRIEDSIAKITAAKVKPIDPIKAKQDSIAQDSARRVGAAGDFSQAANGQEIEIPVENNFIKVVFTNKGGGIKRVELKTYTTQDKKAVILNGNPANKLGYSINTAANASVSTNDLFFSPAAITELPNGTQQINFSLNNSSGQSIVHQYTLKKDSYTIDWNVQMNGATQLLSNGVMNIVWKSSPEKQEKYPEYERQMSNICFSEDNEFDYISVKTEHQFEKPAQWVGVVQQFFNSTLIAKNNFSTGKISWNRRTDSSNVLSDVELSAQVKLPVTATVSVPFQFYFGPNDISVLKNQAAGMDRIVNLGRDAYSFVRPINRYIIMPVFEFITSFISSYGWAIALLTLFIRLVTAPLTYTSYLSGAKMKVLRPELDALKKKLGDDQQGYAMEQMKLFREAGVNPLGGCIPALLQIPIFFALYSFFNSAIDLRGQNFLWADDLSQYDVIARLPFSIPMGFGDHISLFTITAVLTSFLISIYNMAMTPTQDNPALKYMPYIFPFILLFIFNRLPSALTWYYTVSNLMTLGLQFVIQNYIINHDKILAKMQENKQKPKKQSKWQEKYQQMMESQKKLQDLKEKNDRSRNNR